MALNYAFFYHPAVAKDLAMLSREERLKLGAALERLLSEPEKGRALRGTLSGWRVMAAGGWKAVYRVSGKLLEVAAIRP